ncbi:helix-turn-helix domain-containing protein [Mahella australiensis]|uniref:helix-turn-helix domain-containing protein n=1 Tax=Mahella australiensis TaxID=252966 RepID=UPI001494B33F|nr:helix-turn-helix domain-containing protein [Mahella australiensis]
MAEFDKEKFAELLNTAKGNRSIRKYADDSGISPAHISRLLRKITKVSPEPDTIRKLAEAAYNNVTYEDFMIAAGYIDAAPSTSRDNIPSIPAEDIEKYKISRRDIKQYEDVMQHTRAFFMNDKVSDEDKEQLMYSLMEVFLHSKKINKEKYGKKQKRIIRSEVYTAWLIFASE